MPPYALRRLANGLTAVVMERPGRHQVLVTLMVRVGSRFEPPAQAGVSHFVEHLLFRGNAAYPDTLALTRAFEQCGAMLNAATGVESTEFQLTAHPSRLDEVLERLALFVREPGFTDLEKERQIILDEMLYDYNEQGELIDLATLCAQLLWPEHPLGQAITGTPQSLARLTQDDLRRHHRQGYQPANMVLALAGAVDAAQGIALAEKHFGGWGDAAIVPLSAPAAPPPAQPAASGRRSPALKLVHDPDSQLHVQLTFAAPGYNAPEELPLALLSRLLDDGPSSLLQRVVREERALVYSLSAGYTGYCDAGQFDFVTSVKPERVGELLECVLGLLRRFRDEGPTAAEIEQARQRIRFDLEFSRDSLGSSTDRFAWPLLYSTIREEDQELEQINRLHAAGLRDLAGQLFRAERLHAAVVGPLDGAVEAVLRSAIESF